MKLKKWGYNYYEMTQKYGLWAPAKRLLLVCALSLFTLLALVAPLKATAAPQIPSDGRTTVTQFDKLPGFQARAQAWTELQTLLGGHCSGREIDGQSTQVTGTNLGGQDLIDGKWFEGNTVYGSHVTGNDNGRLECLNENNWFSNLARAAGYADASGLNMSGLAKDVGITDVTKPSNTDPRVTGRQLATKLFGTNNPGRPDWMSYYLAQYHFLGVCKAVEAPASGSDAYNRLKLQGGREIKIHLADPATKSSPEKLYMYGMNENAKLADSNIDIGFNNGIDGDATVTCEQLANHLASENPAKAFLNQLNFYTALGLDTGGAVAGLPAGQNSTPSCENTGFSLIWIMCGIIDGLAEAVNGIFSNIIYPMLKTPSILDNDKLKSAWSSFRVIADILLVIVLIVIVFGESIGGGLIDAYAAKKMLPKLLLAAIFINISYYLFAAALDITNVIAGGIGQLITAPFGLQDGNGNFNFDLSGQGGGAQLIQTAGGTLAGAAAINHLFAISATAGSASIGTTMTMLFFSVLVPLIVIAVSIIVVLAIRLGLIFALVLAAPIAGAAWVLPNTQKYARKWWELTQEVLLVYPIIVVMVALSQVIAQTSIWANNGQATEWIAWIVSLIILIIPLGAIPFAFKLAGGLLGRFHDLTNTGLQRGRSVLNGNEKDPNSRRNIAARNWQTANIQAREDKYNQLMGAADSKGRVGRGLTKARARYLVGGYNIAAATSAQQAQVGKELNDQIATGRDEEIRALTVNKSWAQQQRQATKGADGKWQEGEWVTDANGNQHYELAQWRQKADGSKQYRTLGGAWVSESEVDAGQARWGRNKFAQQTALAYEMRKAQDETQAQNLVDNYRAVAAGPGGWGNTEQQLQGSWIGASFEHANGHLAYKYTDQSADNAVNGRGTMTEGKQKTFVDEVRNKRGSYNMAQMDSYTIEKLRDSYKDSYSWKDKEAAQLHREKITDIAETFVNDFGMAGGGGNDDEIAQRVAQAQAQAAAAGVPTSGGSSDRSSQRRVNTPGAAAVSQRVYQLAELTGVLAKKPDGTYHPNMRRQSLGNEDNQQRTM